MRKGSKRKQWARRKRADNIPLNLIHFLPTFRLFLVIDGSIHRKVCTLWYKRMCVRLMVRSHLKRAHTIVVKGWLHCPADATTMTTNRRGLTGTCVTAGVSRSLLLGSALRRSSSDLVTLFVGRHGVRLPMGPKHSRRPPHVIATVPYYWLSTPHVFVSEPSCV